MDKIPDVTRPEDLPDPDLTGAICGEFKWAAWKIPASGDPSKTDVGAWFLFCPGAHPCWSWWVLAAISLEDRPGIPPAKISFEGATHEVLIHALDPETDHGLDLTRVTPLQPVDLVHQVRLPGDELAVELLELCARRCMRGDISPDSDFRLRWKKILDATSEHLLGGHGAQA